jgi:hypothetical protein
MAVWSISSHKLIDGDAQSPNVCQLATNDLILVVSLEHLWSVVVLSAHHSLESIVRLVVDKGTHAKVNEDSFLIVINHYIFRLDIAMDHFYNLVAVVQSSEKVDQVQLHFAIVQSILLTFWFVFVNILKLLTKRTLAVVLSY